MTNHLPALHLLALYVGEPATIATGRRSTRSGIHKQPRPDAWVDVAGLRGDHVMNRKYHGGPDQAVYLYTQPDAAAWEELGLHAGPERSYFGENVRVDGLSSADVRPGDRLHFGEVTLEATAPRLPCALAAAYLRDVYPRPSFVKDFYALGRPGIYARVLRPGRLQAGGTGFWEPAGTDAPTLAELMALHRTKAPDPAALQRALLAPVSHRTREELGEQLARLG